MASKKQTLVIKQGDTFELPLWVQNTSTPEANAIDKLISSDQAAPSLLGIYSTHFSQDISTWTIASTLSWGTRPVFEFPVSIVDAANGKFTLTATAEQTETWHPRTYNMDIQFIIDDKVHSTESFLVKVLRQETK